jgi:hypothetical protein
VGLGYQKGSWAERGGAEGLGKGVEWCVELQRQTWTYSQIFLESICPRKLPRLDEQCGNLDQML